MSETLPPEQQSVHSSDQLKGMHVRIPAVHITLAKLLAKTNNLSLTGYIDKLIVDDAGRKLSEAPEEMATVIGQIDQQIDELTLTKVALLSVRPITD